MESVGGSSAVVINSTLLLLGGFVNRTTTASFMYLSESKFHNVTVGPPRGGPAEPGPIAFQGAVAIRDKFKVVYGGFGMATGINPSVWLFVWSAFPSREYWCKASPGPSKPPPHFAAGLVLIKEDIYAYGGRIHPAGHDEQLASDMWKFEGIEDKYARCTQQYEYA